jgi:hypothetical protein
MYFWGTSGISLIIKIRKAQSIILEHEIPSCDMKTDECDKCLPLFDLDFEDRLRDTEFKNQVVCTQLNVRAKSISKYF